MNKPTHGTPIGWRTKSKAVCGRCAAITHNRRERANQMLCHFKGERALIAFRLTSLNQPRSFISQTWQSRKLSAYILKCMPLLYGSLSPRSWSAGCQCLYVCLCKGEGRARAQCPNQLLGWKLFMGRWSCIRTLQAKSTSGRYHTLYVSSGR